MASSGEAKQGRLLRVLVDTNVVLDQLLKREPWYSQAQPFWDARDAGQLVAYLSASIVTDIFYISRKLAGHDMARDAVLRCLREFGVLAVYRAVLDAALTQTGPDFEDNVLIACGEMTGMDMIVTRDAAGYRQSPIPAIAPAAIAAYLTP